MNSASTQSEWKLHARFQEGLSIKIFLMAWLSGWAVGEATALVSLAPHVGWIMEHWREVSPMRGGEVSFPIAPDNREGQLFAAGWLVLWTVGGLISGAFLLWLLFGADTITLDGTELVFRRQLGPFHWTSRLLRGSIRLLTISPTGGLIAETAARRSTLSILGTKVERERTAAELQATLEATVPQAQAPDVSPVGWTMTTASDGWTELVRSAEAFQPAVIQGTWMAAMLIAAVAPEVISPLSFLHGMPQLFALIGAGSFAFSTYRTLANTSRIRIRGKELVVTIGYPLTIEQHEFTHPQLSVKWNKPKDQNEVYTLSAEEDGRTAKLLTSRNLATPALELGEWLAARLEVKLQVPKELDST